MKRKNVQRMVALAASAVMTMSSVMPAYAEGMDAANEAATNQEEAIEAFANEEASVESSAEASSVVDANETVADAAQETSAATEETSDAATESTSQEAVNEGSSEETTSDAASSAQSTDTKALAASSAASSEQELTVEIDAEDVTNTVYTGALPDQLMLGMFFNSETDCSDTLYVSFDGLNFQQISVAMHDSTPDDASEHKATDFDWIPGYVSGNASTLHDPGLQYDAKRGVFWSNSAFTMNGMLIPMLSYSKDLVHWSIPNSGSGTNTSTFVGQLPYTWDGKREATQFDCAAPEIFVDTDGTMYVSASLGHYEGSLNDKMSIYMVQVSNLANELPDLPTQGSQADINVRMWDTGILAGASGDNSVSYSKMYEVGLDSLPSPSDNALYTDNYIDSSIFKDPDTGVYYMSVKRDGIVNEIWQSNTLDITNRDAWTRVTYDAVAGYEGPTLTKMNGHYYMYVDKLKDYPELDPATHSYDYQSLPVLGKTGIYVIESDDLVHWSDPVAITTNNNMGTRHGSVITLRDKSAIQTVMNACAAVGISYKNEKAYTAKASTYTGWKHIGGGNMFWYENGLRQGTVEDANGVYYDGTNRGREIYDSFSDGWYWLDAVNDGAKAMGKEVFMPYVYQDEKKWDEDETRKNANASDAGMQDFAYDVIKKGQADDQGRGKWVRYDGGGKMLKDFVTIKDSLASVYPDQKGNVYYYDNKTGLMAKGHLKIHGKDYYFDEVTGVLQGKP